MGEKCTKNCLYAIGCSKHINYKSEVSIPKSETRFAFSKRIAENYCRSNGIPTSMAEEIVENLSLQMSVSNETLARNIKLFQEISGNSVCFSLQSNN